MKPNQPSDKKHDPKPGRVEGPIFILLIAGVGFFALSFIFMGLAPWTTLKKLNNPPEGFVNPYLAEDGTLNAAGRGREIYINEGCWHCHSQFVRPVGNDPLRYGPTSQGWESMFDIPQTFGTRRIGPDLAREAGRRTDDWHMAHLYNPRDTVPLSVMPSYPWFFEETNGKIVPKQEARDVVAYMQSLGARYKDQVVDMAYPKPITVHAKDFTITKDSMQRAEKLFVQNCAGCHGPAGNGKSKANLLLEPSAVSLQDRYLTSAAAFEVLFSGVRGSGMPSFHEMTQKDLWAVSHYVSDLGLKVKEESLKAEQKEDVLNLGKTTYQTYCVSCHGLTGAPEGPVAEALVPKPRDFSRRLFSLTSLQEVLRDGRKGTSMPAFTNLQPEEVEHLSVYLNSLFTEEGK